jgi:two-component system chemotaxis sensor kinase CheA
LQLTPAESTDRFVVVAQVGGALLGLIVDRVFDTEEIVVKPIAPILRHLSVFGGNTILGDGSVIMILDPNGIARAVGLAGAEERPEEAARAEALDVERSALLLMRAGGEALMAVPLRLVARLEQVARADVERSAGGPVTQYRGRLMKLITLAQRPDDPAEWPANSPVLVFARGRHIAGLVVDEIVDVVQDQLNVQLGAAGPGLLGSAVIDGRATDLLDVGYHLSAAITGWFEEESEQASARVLLVGGGRVAGLVPVLAAGGYGVATANDEAGALRLRDGGARFDAVIVDRPSESDGFIRALRDAGAWRGLPLIALVGRVPAPRLAQMRAAGWTDCVPGGDRGLLADSLASCLSATVAA